MIFQLARRNIVCAAIHCDLVAASDKSRGQMFCEGFETSVASRYAARSEDGDAHKPENDPYKFTLNDFFSCFIPAAFS